MRKIYLFIALGFIWGCQKNQTQLADDLFAQGKYNEAIQAYSTYLADHPTDEKSLYNRGRAYEEQGELRRALEDFREAVTLAPDNVKLRLSLGLCYYKLEQYTSTVNAMDELLKRKPNESQAFYLKGRALQKVGKIQDAIEQYSNAIRYDNRHGEAYLYRGLLVNASKKGNRGCDDLRQAQALGVEGAEKVLEKDCR